MGYEARLARGELGILAPSGSNVAGADYATAARLPSGEFEIIVSDLKSRASEGSAFGRAPSMLTQSWQDEVQDALAPGRLNFGDPTVEQGIRDAWAEGRIRIVRDTVDFSIRGQGALKLGN
jgi:hypothetical protein